jgi:putative ATP-dependent endonuclease of the OLD family
MQISKVQISNYRGIKNDEFNSSTFVCVIGENNAGKSTILLAISLFFSGTSLNESDFYDLSEPVIIEITFINIEEGDKKRLHDEHKERINEVIIDGELTLTRRYYPNCRAELLCKRLSPKDGRFSKEVVSGVIKGKKGKEIEQGISSILPDYAEYFKGLTTQTAVFSKVDEIISTLPTEDLEFKLAPLPTGIPESIYSFLPEPIYIAAVKDLKDEVKTKESTSFGKLLGILLKSLEGSEDLKGILGSFDQLHGLLNRINTDTGIEDRRIELLKSMETLISTYLKENFPRAEIELEIPKPELKQVFSNARILIDDGVKDLVKTKGDGLKRSVTFALLRSYVEHSKAQKKKNIAEQLKPTTELEEGVDVVVEIEEIPQPYVFLFEEPELFLHPNAQLILFEALEKLTQIGNQVFVTTHSPLFFSPRATGTFVKVIKQYPDKGKPFGKLITVNLLEEKDAKDAFQIICYENNAAAFFSHKVLLVEGDSDLIYLKAVAKILNEDWSFDYRNIPIISIDGKSNVKRFIEFYQSFGIRVFSLLDADAMIEGFEKFDVPAEITHKRSDLLAILDGIAEERQLRAIMKAAKIKELVRRYTWKQKYENLKTLARKVTGGQALTEDEIIEIDYLFAEEDNSLRRQVFTDVTIHIPQKDALLCELMSYDIFVLSKGAIESYYPPDVTGADKPTKALKAIEILKGANNLHELLPRIRHNDEDKCELRLIFSNIFA